MQQFKIIGSMASFPKRAEMLEANLPAILAQVDRLDLYLNGFNSVPEFCAHPKINVVLARDAAGDLRDNGKFYHPQAAEEHYRFTFDDDIRYPADYVEKMIAQIEALGRKAVVGVHGVIYPRQEILAFSQRRVFNFGSAAKGRYVDLLGTGTTAWHSSTLAPQLEDFKTKGLCDLWFCTLAARQGVPFYCVPRAEAWLEETAGRGPSIFRQTRTDPTQYLDLLNNHVMPALLEREKRLKEAAES